MKEHIVARLERNVEPNRTNANADEDRVSFDLGELQIYGRLFSWHK